MAFDIISIKGRIRVGDSNPRFLMGFDENKGAWTVNLNEADTMVLSADEAKEFANDIEVLTEKVRVFCSK